VYTSVLGILSEPAASFQLVNRGNIYNPNVLNELLTIFQTLLGKAHPNSAAVQMNGTFLIVGYPVLKLSVPESFDRTDSPKATLCCIEGRISLLASYGDVLASMTRQYWLLSSKKNL
jgi:hypothetical protein